MAAKLHQVYRCAICGNIVEVVHGGGGTVVCCDQDMVLQVENSVDASQEKHVPVVEINGNKVKVKIGSAPHPMESVHYIEWIEILVDLPFGASAKEGLPENISEITARAYCNLHGLWKE